MENIVFDSFFENTIEGILIIEDGFIINVNNAMLDILHYKSKDSLIGKLATGILIPNISQKYLEYNNEVYEEVSLISKSGEIIPAIIKIKDIKENNKNYKMVFILNLTEFKEKETFLLEQSRMAAMGEMISMIAHQWRQPLSSIAAVVSNLQFRINIGKYEAEVFEDKISDIDRYLKYMSGTIDDFRNFFKPDKKKELINLSDIITIALKMIEKPFENRDIKIINNQKELEKMYAYKNELLQVILNIFNNSKDAFSENETIINPTVLINYEDFDKYQILTISDNAGGIDEDIINKIFDPYFSTKDAKNGTGLGLYMCKIIVEKHCNGEIKVSNINNGASFEIRIGK